MKRKIACALALLLLPLTVRADVRLQEIEVEGFFPMKIVVGIEDGKIASFDVTEHSETPGFGADVIERGFDSLIGQSAASADFDAISGATMTSGAIQEALRIAAEGAGIPVAPTPTASPAPTSKPTPSPTPEPTPSPTPAPTPSPTPEPTKAPAPVGYDESQPFEIRNGIRFGMTKDEVTGRMREQGAEAYPSDGLAEIHCDVLLLGELEADLCYAFWEDALYSVSYTLRDTDVSAFLLLAEHLQVKYGAPVRVAHLEDGSAVEFTGFSDVYPLDVRAITETWHVGPEPVEIVHRLEGPDDVRYTLAYLDPARAAAVIKNRLLLMYQDI